MSRTVSFQPLLFGGDINVYSVARAFHEAYGVKSVAFGKFHTFPCAFSSIIDYRTCPDNEDPAVFLSNVEKVALEFSHKTVIVLGCGDSYVQLCAHLKDQFPRNVVAPYIDGALLDRLINKEHFYELCDPARIDPTRPPLSTTAPWATTSPCPSAPPMWPSRPTAWPTGSTNSRG